MRSEVRLFPDPPLLRRDCALARGARPVSRRCHRRTLHGAVAQLGEHLLCKQGVTGSIPVSSTISNPLIQRQTEKANGVGFRFAIVSREVGPRLLFRSLTIWNDPSIEVEYDFDIRRTVFFCICPRLFGVVWSSELAHTVDA